MCERTTKTSKTVTVEKRGGFHDDSFFKDSWDSWDKAMKDVVQKWNTNVDGRGPNTTSNTSRTTTTSTVSKLPSTETSSIYRKIRSSNVTSDESQAVSCTEEDDRFKIVIDVKDFKPEDIHVKVVDDKIVVEGKIEKKEGNSVSTQQFVRRFLLPSTVDFAKISSALSKDGVLKINAPKLASKSRPSITSSTRPITTSTRSITTSTRPITTSTLAAPAAGVPSDRSQTFTPFGSGNKANTREVTTFTTTVPDRRVLVSTEKDDWSSSFDQMVEKSQREMQEMMNRHTLHTAVEPPAPASGPATSTTIAVPLHGVTTTRDVIRKGDVVTEIEDKRWEDTPTPGVTRQHHAVSETSKLRGHDGTILGNQERRSQESHSSGGNEEILPDGTKRTTFTKSYETRKVFTSSSSHPKAL